jgi:two-component system, OmpR family, sensor kinase
VTWSIRARLTAWYSAVVVIVLVVGAIAVAVVQARLGLERLDGELERLMLTLEGVMRTEFNLGDSLEAAADEASTEVVAPDRTLILTRPDGTRLAIWGLPVPESWHAPSVSSTTVDSIKLDTSHRVRMRSRLVDYKGHRYFATVLAPLDGLERERSELLLALTAGVLVAMGVAAVGGWIVGRQTLQPLSDMATQATGITERNLSDRLSTPHKDDELGRVATAFNAVLDRLATALHAQRQFMAEASHQVRTPVSVVHTAAQVMLARDTRPEQDYRDALTVVGEQSERLRRLVDAMFLLSRAEAQGIPLVREPLYLDELVSECARALRVVAGERSVRVTTSGDTEVALTGDDTLLRQMVGNLLDNAIRHARPGGWVSATVERNGSKAVVRVIDDGPGVPPEQRERVFQRFVQLDSSNGGAGLGLPIARWIAEAHGGHLVLEATGTGGASFAATLPLS